MGLFATSEDDLRKAGDINVNLWMGIGMLATAALFALWVRLRLLVVPDAVPEKDGD